MRPHLEYGNQVWDPHLSKDKKCLENVQKFAFWIASACWDASYDDLLEHFDLQTLQECRLHAKLSVLFKLIHKLWYYTNDTFVTVSNLAVTGPIITYKFLFILHTLLLFFTLFVPHTQLWQSKHDKTIKQQCCKCTSPKVKLPEISRVQKVENQILHVLLIFVIFCTCNNWFSTFCTLDILGSLTFGLLHCNYYCCLIVLSCLDCYTQLLFGTHSLKNLFLPALDLPKHSNTVCLNLLFLFYLPLNFLGTHQS